MSLNPLLDLEPEPDMSRPAFDLEPEPDSGHSMDEMREILPTLEPEPDTDPADDVLSAHPNAAPPAPLVEVLGADFPLPLLARFIPDVRLRDEAAHATAYALGIEVTGADGIERADVALTALRASQNAITEHFAEPVDIANRLHKRLTGIRSEWCEPGKVAIETVGRRIWTEKKRLDDVAAAERRREQEEADRRARQALEREAEQAAAANAPKAVVDDLKEQARTATAPPVLTPTVLPSMRGSSTVTTWKCRPKGTPADAEPNPKVGEMSKAQLEAVRELIAAIIEGRAPISAIEINYAVLNARAKADKSTFAIPGFEAYQDGSVRAKSRRA
jgi:hypothetical protein